jgi:hypothetical protein
MGGGHEPPMDVLKNWMEEQWESNLNGHLSYSSTAPENFPSQIDMNDMTWEEDFDPSTLAGLEDLSDSQLDLSPENMFSLEPDTTPYPPNLNDHHQGFAQYPAYTSFNQDLASSQHQQQPFNNNLY